MAVFVGDHSFGAIRDYGVHQACFRVLTKGITGVAVLVFIVANPIGDNSGIAVIASIVVLVACGLAWAMLEVFGGLEERPKDTSHIDK